MPSTPKDVEARITQAAEAMQRAATAAERDSRAALDRLVARTPDQRFAALEDGAPQLLPEHRRELLNSLRDPGVGPEAPALRVGVRHASRIAVWRERLPYRARRLTRDALLLVCLTLALGLAYRRTPTAWVEVQGTQDVRASWIMPNGRIDGDRLVAGRAYALMRQTGDEAELRDWRPGEGYAEARVPVAWLQTRSGPTSR